MQFNFEPFSRHRFVVLYDPTALPGTFPVDADLTTPEPDPPPHDAVRELATLGCAFVVEVPSEEDCQATMRVFVNETPPAEIVKKAKRIMHDSSLRIPGGTLRADGSEFMCLLGQTREEADSEAVASVPAGDYLMTVYELVRWKLRNRRAEIRARAKPLARFVDAFTQGLGVFCAVLFVAHILVVPAVLWFTWSKHGWQSALKVGGIILAVDAAVYSLILVFTVLQKKSMLFSVSDVRNQFDAEHPDFLIVLENANRRPGSGDPALFKWPQT